MNQTAVIYARYSSHNQRDVSIDQQEKACRQYARTCGIDVLDVYEDHALTGTNDRRPGFQRMIRDAAAGAWDYVIVYTLDRFARDRYDSAVYKRQLKACGVRVLSAMEQISDDPTGVLMESLLEGLAEYYSVELSRKIRRGMEDNASKCLVNGSCPLGYTRGQDGRYAVVEPEAALVREIYRRVADHEPFIQIIDDLNARGLLTKKGVPWNRSSFNRLLSNERYTGVYIYGQTRIPGGIPEIIPRELYDSVQQELGTRKNPRREHAPQRRRRETGTYLLTGKLYCGRCGAPMVGISSHGRHGESHFYYTCRAKKEHHACDKHNVPRDQIEALLAAELRRTVFVPEVMEALADAAIAWQDSQPEAADVENLTRDLAATESAIHNLVHAMELGVFSQSTQSRLQELEQQQRKLTAALSVAQAQAAQRLTRPQILATLELFAEGDLSDPDYQAALLDTFLHSAYVFDDHVKVVFTLDSGRQAESTLPLSALTPPPPASSPGASNLPTPPPNRVIRTQPPIYTVNGLFWFCVALQKNGTE